MSIPTSSSLNDDPEQLRQEILNLVERYHAASHPEQSFNSNTSPVPVSGRVYDAEDMRSLVNSSLDFWLTTGRFNDSFEQKLRQFLGARKALTVNSGSSANLVALASLTAADFGDRALKAGDEIITCATGFPTTLNPALLYGLTPVFLDVDIPTYNIDVTRLEEAISEKTKAIMIAHTLGNPFNVAAVMEVAKKHNLWVIEDCCDALGSKYDGKMVGTFGDIGTLSFYPAHHITTGEGGAVFTNRPKINQVMESVRDWGRDCFCAPGKDNTCGKRFEWKLGDLPEGYDHKYIYSRLGFNLKLTDMQAAIGVSQMDHLDGFIQTRKRNFETIRNGLKDLEEFFVLPEATPNSDPSWFGFPLTVREGVPFSRNDLLRYLNDQRIGTRLLFGSNLLRQPYMIGRPNRIVGNLTNSDIVVARSFWLGVYPGLGETEIAYMLEHIHSFCGNA